MRYTKDLQSKCCKHATGVKLLPGILFSILLSVNQVNLEHVDAKVYLLNFSRWTKVLINKQVHVASLLQLPTTSLFSALVGDSHRIL